ncbi:MAG: FkbM family methyltransferase [Actinomycetes bacterium]
MNRMRVKKAVRSLLFRTPRVYDLMTSQARYCLLHALGRVHEAEFHALPALVGRPDPLVVDVGGNIGQSVLSVLTVLPRARVVTFEPNPVSCASLQRLAARFPRVTVEQVGLSDRTGEALLFCPSYNGKVMAGLASFDREAASTWLGPDTVLGFRPDRLHVAEHRLPLRPLDSYGLSPDIVKIDVQGLEPAVIRGGLETIKRSKPILMVEAEPAGGEADTLLAPLGYRLVGYRDGRFVPLSMATTNRFFVPNETMAAGTAAGMRQAIGETQAS